MKFNERIVRCWGDAPFHNPLAFIQCLVGDMGIALRLKICKKLNWKVSEYSAKLKQENPPTAKEMEIITAIFFKEWAKLGARIAKRYKADNRKK